MADLPKGLRWRNGVLWIDLRYGTNQRHRVSTKTDDVGLATQKLRDAEKAIYLGTITAKGPSKGMTLQEGFDLCIRTHWRGDKSVGTVHTNFKAVLAVIPGTRPLADITVEDYDAIVVDQLSKGNTLKTANRKMIVLSTILNKALELRVLSHVPRVPLTKEHRGRTRIYTEAEAVALIAAFDRQGDTRMARACEVLLDMGLRAGELAACQPEDVANGAVTLWRTKGNAPRTLPLTMRAAAALEVIFTHRDGRLSEDAMTRRFKALRDTLGLGDEAVLHTFRHTCCTRLFQNGKDALLIMEWMGHKSLETTMNYRHLDAGKLRPLAASLEPVSPAGCSAAVTKT